MLPSTYLKLRSNFWLHLFTLNLRNLLGIGFLIGGLRKINGQPFANPGQEGAFFEFLDALHANLIYYEFVGWAQLIAGILLLTQRYATVGAVIYFPIILNIMVFTVFSVGTLTPWIASFMCLGTLYLLLWDYPKWVNLFRRDNELIDARSIDLFPTYDTIWVMSGIIVAILPTIGFLFLMGMGMEKGHVKWSTEIFFGSVLLTIAINFAVNVSAIRSRKHPPSN